MYLHDQDVWDAQPLSNEERDEWRIQFVLYLTSVYLEIQKWTEDPQILFQAGSTSGGLKLGPHRIEIKFTDSICVAAAVCTIKVASSNTPCLEAHAGFFRLFMKGIFDPYVLWPFGKKLVFYLVTSIRTRDYTVVEIRSLVVFATRHKLSCPIAWAHFFLPSHDSMIRLILKITK